MKPLKVPAGTYIIREGDDGDDFFVIEEGIFNIFRRENKADVSSDGKLILTLHEEGSFGELALL